MMWERSRVLAIAALVVLVAAAALFVHAVHRAATSDASAAHTGRPPYVLADTAPTPAATVQSEAIVMIAVELDPFRPDRAPPLPGADLFAATGALQDTTMQDSATGMEIPLLYGTSTGGSARSSALIAAGAVSPRVVHAGDSIAGFRVQRIGRAEAVLVSEDTVLVLSVAAPKRK